MGVRVNAERDLDIWRERKEHGTTLKAIGQKHGISGPRVRQVVAREDRRLAWRVRHEEILRQKEQVMEDET